MAERGSGGEAGGADRTGAGAVGADPGRAAGAADPGAAGAGHAVAGDFDRERMRAEVAEGLKEPQKRLSPKYFYDARGSELFEAITRLDEYYPTRTERGLLEAHAAPLVARIGPRSLVELGAGSALKTRLLLDAMVADGRGITYVPVDVSRAFLMEVARELVAEYPDLHVLPAVADMSQELPAEVDAPRPALFAILGSTIGNFLPPAAQALLRRVRRLMGGQDALLLGVDLHKDVATLEAAYDDAAGVTAEFNRNILRVLNSELGADFDPDAFEHHAFYNEPERRVEMHLVARAPQRVEIPGIGTIELERGESIHTESSCKYERASVESLFAAADLALTRWITDDQARFALALGAPIAGDGRAPGG